MKKEEADHNPEDQELQKIRGLSLSFRSAEWIKQRFLSTFGIDSRPIEREEVIENKEDVRLRLKIAKTGREIRQRYYDKLRSEGILKDTPSQNHQHIFIFDWDDTLLFTTFLRATNFWCKDRDTLNDLKVIDEIEIKLFQSLLKIGKVYIVSNGEKGWVDQSSRYFLPKVHEFLKQKKVEVLSAQYLFGGEYPEEEWRWKVETFRKIFQNVNHTLLTNLVVMGDSNVQMTAGLAISKEVPNVILKTIKFSPRPSSKLLKKEIISFSEQMNYIISRPENFVINFEH